MLNKSFFLTVVCILLPLPYLFSQKTEAEFKQFFFNKIGVLETIEGIYDVSLRLSGPTIKCNYCEYSDVLISNIDKIAIYRENNLVRVFSITKGVDVGFIELWNSYHARFSSNGASNYMNSGEFYEIKDSFYLFRKMLKLEVSKQFFDYSVLDKYKFKCSKDGDKELICQLANKGFTIESKVKKSFPNKNEPPPTYTKSGSGVIISDSGYILTNRHVVTRPKTYFWRESSLSWVENYQIGLLSSISTRIQANISGINYDLVPVVFWGEDLALLKIVEPPRNIKSAIIDTTSQKLGDILYTLGYPMIGTIGSSVKYSQGYLSSKEIFKNPDIYPAEVEEMLVMNMSINPGNSGGGVFNHETGCLVGIATSRPDDDQIGFKTEGLSFATELNSLVEKLKKPLKFKVPIKKYDFRNIEEWTSVYEITSENVNPKNQLNYLNGIPIKLQNPNQKLRLNLIDNQAATVLIKVE